MAAPLATRQIDGIRDSLARITASPLFTRAEKQTNFLRYIVEKYLSGDTASIKEYEIGTAVYQRPESYDPREDPIVRVEASRLRARIREYYTTTGKDDPIQIDLPKGGYLPVFLGLPSAEPEPVAKPEPVVTPAPAPISVPAPAPVPAHAPALSRRVSPLLILAAALLVSFAYWNFSWKPARDAERRAMSERTFQQAMDLHTQMTPAAVNEARHLHEAIVKSDSNWARAHSGLAHTYISLISVGGATREQLGPTALAEARKSLDLEPQLDDGYAALVRYYRDVELDFNQVETTCRSALEKVTSPFRILVNCAPVQSLRGNHEIAELWARDAVRLRPQWEYTWFTQAMVLWRAGRAEDAVAPARKAVEVDPTSIGSRGILAMIAAEKKDFAEAERVMRAGLPSSGIDREEWYAYLGYIAAVSGNKEVAARMVQRLEERARTHVVSPVSFARIRMGEGNLEAALTLLEEGVRRRDIEVAMFLTSPEAQPLKTNPRYQATVRALGLKPIH